MDTATLTTSTLHHGLRVAVRPLAPDDRMDLLEGFDRLSPLSRYRRFLTGKSRLSDAEVSRLFDRGHLAYVLVWPRTSCPDVLLGIAHAIPLPGQPDTAEFSIVVADEIHGRGGGTLLTRVVAQAARRDGLRRLSAYMLATNAAPARLLAGVGEVEVDRIESGYRDMVVRLA